MYSDHGLSMTDQTTHLIQQLRERRYTVRWYFLLVTSVYLRTNGDGTVSSLLRREIAACKIFWNNL